MPEVRPTMTCEACRGRGFADCRCPETGEPLPAAEPCWDCGMTGEGEVEYCEGVKVIDDVEVQ